MSVSSESGLEWLPAVEAAAAIRDGRITSRELTEACLDNISRQEATIGAWTHLDRDHALFQADMADDDHRHGRAQGALHGVPVGVKDIFDTRDMPTEDGSPLHAGRTPRKDAAAVALLRAAGAVIMGKTVTTEFASYHPGKTVNPRDPGRSPGGSSSGSAAAVAAGMVPLAIGSQTNGSVIRPAGYCGVVGYKPSFGSIPRTGALRLSRALDHVGVFARTVPDAALIAECLFGHDAGDPDTRPVARPPLLASALSTMPMPPRLAFVPTPLWDQAEPVTQAAFAELVEVLGDHVERFDLPARFAEGADWLKVVMETDMASNLRPEYEQGGDKLSPTLRALLQRGREQHRAFDYASALAAIPVLNEALDEAFFAYDAFITPGTTGVAPLGRDSTGSPIFCSLWTLCGVPTINLPLLHDEAGLPIGLQLVGPRGGDARLLRTAQWLMTQDFG